MRYFITNVVLLGMAIVFLYHFGLIWIYGEFLIKEANLAVLVAETLFIVEIIVLGIFNIIDFVRRK